MQFDFLSVMAYLIVAITVLTMVFGLLAYSVYKIRENKRAQKKVQNKTEQEKIEADKMKYLFFEHKEIQL